MATMTFKADLVPNTNQGNSLGTAKKKWKINGVDSPILTDTWIAMTGATSSTNGTVGYVNAVPPKDGYNTKYFRADGTWAVPPNTKVNVKSRGTTKAYLLATSTSPTSTNQAVESLAETGVYLDTTAAKLVATTFKGALDGTAAKATKLAEAKTIQTDLTSTSSASFDGSANITPGVKGTLPIGNGGTGKTEWTADGLLYASAATTLASKKPAWEAWGTGTTAGPTAKIQLGNKTYESAAIPSASADNSGIVTTGTQTFGGKKEISLISPSIYDREGNANQYKTIYFRNLSNTLVGTINYDSGDTSKVTSGRLYFVEYSPKKIADTATTGFYELYSLPTVNTARETNGNYTILTTKEKVKLSEGGTGRNFTTSSYVNGIVTMPSTIDDNNNLTATQTKSGALYATATNGTAQFGTLPVGQGGTGVTSITSGNLLVGAGKNDITSIAKTSANTASTVVQRDASGNFSAGTITASLSGNATTATTATNLSAKPLLAASGNNITVTAGGKTSDAFTIPYATIAGKISDLNENDNASSNTTARRVWFTYTDGTTGRPALSDNFTYVTSTKTLNVANVNGNAATATTLKNARTLKVNLASTSASTGFDGSANITDIGVSGILPVGNGGTGHTSWTGNRMVWTNATGDGLVSGNHYVDADHVGVNTTTIPNDANGNLYHLYVNGKIAVTSNIIIKNTNRGLYLTDSSGTVYPGILDNGTNLWIGSSTNAGPHHTGGTYISAGVTVNGNTTTGNKSIYVSLPNDNNNGATNYRIVYGTGGSTSRPVYIDSDGKVTAITGAIANDTTGNAATATKLGTADKGSTNKPIYLDAGVPKPISYEINKTVPADADFDNNKVTQTETTDSNNRFAVLFSSTASNDDTGSTITSTARKASNFSYNPSFTRLRISRSDHDQTMGLYLDNSDTTNPLTLGYIIGTENGGIYDYTHGVWKLSITPDGATTLNGNAATATKATKATQLETAREIYVSLGSARDTDNKVTFDGTAAKAIAVSGRLGLANGGTGYDLSSIDNWAIIRNSGPGYTGLRGISTASGALYATGTNTEATFGTLPIAQGGTGATTAAGAPWVRKTGETMSGNLVVETASSPVLRVRDTTNNNISTYILVGSNHQNHGLYSNGYAPTESTFTSSAKWIIYRGSDGEAHSSLKIYGAVYNDYAEMRNVPEAQTEENPLKPGTCVREIGDGTMVATTERLQRGCKIISDTFGFNIGETEDCKTPIAVSGRALVYLDQDRENARNYIGWPVCSGPNGTVSIMTEEEEEKYPSRIVGTISEIPDYEKWGSSEVEVNGRIWIYVR